MKRKITRIIFFAYTFIVLGMTLFFRTVKQAPMSVVYEGWVIKRTEDGRVDINPVENLVMLIPFTFLLIRGFGWNRRFSKQSVLAASAGISFAFSLFIETMQIVTRLGTFQFSDLFYNTLSGIAGAVIATLLKD